MIYLYILGCLIVLSLAFIYTKNIASPLFINSCVWFFSYILILIGNGYDYVQERPAYALFLFADIMFFLGFIIRIRRIPKKILYPLKQDVTLKKSTIKILIFIEYIFATSIIIKVVPRIAIRSGNIWMQTRRIIAKENLLNILEQYYMTFAYVLFIVCVCIYFSNSTKENRKYLLMQVYPIIPVLLTTHRGNWMMLFIAIIFSYFYIQRPSNKKIAKFGVIFGGILILLITVSMFWKFSDVMDKDDDMFRYLMKVYFVSPFSAFVHIYSRYYEKLYGLNTFRAFFAILQKIGFNVKVNNLVQPFVYVDEMYTNVFTGLGYYMADFGIIGLMVVEMFFGFIFAGIYKKIWKNNRESYFHITVLSFLMYGIINQFFDDKLLSITSTWVQIIFWSWVLTRNWLLRTDKSGFKRKMTKIKFMLGGRDV